MYFIISGCILLISAAVLVRLGKIDESTLTEGRRTLLTVKMVLCVVLLLFALLAEIIGFARYKNRNMTEKREQLAQSYEAEREAARAAALQHIDELYPSDSAAANDTAADDNAAVDAPAAYSVDTSDIRTPEGAYQVLYDEVFSGQGYTYDPTYNAKGNFYGLLYTGKTDNIRITAVYNGESANGKCQVFVEYKEKLGNDGMEETTEIVDFYAVEMQTKRVIQADKHAWDELGSKEYIEATEK